MQHGWFLMATSPFELEILALVPQVQVHGLRPGACRARARARRSIANSKLNWHVLRSHVFKLKYIVKKSLKLKLDRYRCRGKRTRQR